MIGVQVGVCHRASMEVRGTLCSCFLPSNEIEFKLLGLLQASAISRGAILPAHMKSFAALIFEMLLLLVVVVIVTTIGEAYRECGAVVEPQPRIP